MGRDIAPGYSRVEKLLAICEHNGSEQRHGGNRLGNTGGLHG